MLVRLLSRRNKGTVGVCAATIEAGRVRGRGWVCRVLRKRIPVSPVVGLAVHRSVVDVSRGRDPLAVRRVRGTRVGNELREHRLDALQALFKGSRGAFQVKDGFLRSRCQEIAETRSGDGQRLALDGLLFVDLSAGCSRNGARNRLVRLGAEDRLVLQPFLRVSRCSNCCHVFLTSSL